MRQLHREFLRAGSNVMQTFTFYASDDKLENRGNTQRFTVSRDCSCSQTSSSVMREGVGGGGSLVAELA